ncbi:42378_t:CDS:2, partial [Gigaspora margarita]
AVGICVASAAVATPFVSVAAAPWLIGEGAVSSYLLGNKANKESSEREKLMMQNEHYKDANQEVDKQAQQNNQTKHLIDEIVSKLNGKIPFSLSSELFSSFSLPSLLITVFFFFALQKTPPIFSREMLCS